MTEEVITKGLRLDTWDDGLFALVDLKSKDVMFFRNITSVITAAGYFEKSQKLLGYREWGYLRGDESKCYFGGLDDVVGFDEIRLPIMARDSYYLNGSRTSCRVYGFGEAGPMRYDSQYLLKDETTLSRYDSYRDQYCPHPWLGMSNGLVFPWIWMRYLNRPIHALLTMDE